jgi:hypothetical protein
MTTRSLSILMAVFAVPCATLAFRSPFLTHCVVHVCAFVWIYVVAVASPQAEKPFFRSYMFFLLAILPFTLVDFSAARVDFARLGYSPVGLWSLPPILCLSAPLTCAVLYSRGLKMRSICGFVVISVVCSLAVTPIATVIGGCILL